MGGYLIQRNKHKASFMETGVRYDKAVLMDNRLSVEEDVDIDDPRPPSFLPRSPHPVLYTENAFQEGMWSKCGPYLDDTIDEPLLFLKSHRLGSVQR